MSSDALQLPPDSPTTQALAGKTSSPPGDAPLTAQDNTVWGVEAPTWRRDLPQVAGYQILGELGRGGMGIVYLAIDQKLLRRVALKMLPIGITDLPENLARFRAEAATIARLQHPNIVQIYEVGEAEGDPYFALEFVEGGTLREFIGGKPQDPRFAAEVVSQLADAVDYAHRQGVIHRDLKPANVLLAAPNTLSGAAIKDQTQDQPRFPEFEFRTPKITDFGLAKFDARRQGSLAPGSGAATKTGEVLGTPNYMAPEQAEGKPDKVGSAVDIYALGAILYEMLTGRPPFDGPNPMEILVRLATEEPLAPRRLQPKLTRDLETICLTCLRRDPGKRYATGAALAADLRHYLAGEPIQARPTPMWERAWKWTRRRPALATLTAATLVAGLALLVGGWWTSVTLNDALAHTRAAEALAQRNANEAQKLARQADEQRQLALNALQQLVYDVQRKLRNDPQTRDLRAGLLKKAIDGLQEIAKNTAAAEPNLNRVDAHLELGKIFAQIGRMDLAKEQYEVAKTVTEKLLAAAPANLRALDCLTDIEVFLVERLLDQDQPGPALERMTALVGRVAAWQAGAPNDFQANHQLKRCYERLGHIQHWTHHPREALSYFEKSEALARRCVELQPHLPSAQISLALASVWLGRTWRDVGDLEKCVACLRTADGIYKRMLTSSADYSTNITGFLATEDELASVEEELGHPDGARELFVELPRLLEALAAKDPEDAATRLYLVDAYINLGQFEIRQLQIASALVACRKAEAQLNDLRQKGKLIGKRIYEVERPGQIRDQIRYCESILKILENPDADLGDQEKHRGECLGARLRILVMEGQLEPARASFAAIQALPEPNTPATFLKAEAIASALLIPKGVKGFDQSAEARQLREELTRAALDALRLSVHAARPPAEDLLNHESFAALKNHPEYKKLRAELAARHAKTEP